MTELNKEALLKQAKQREAEKEARQRNERQKQEVQKREEEKRKVQKQRQEQIIKQKQERQQQEDQRQIKEARQLEQHQMQKKKIQHLIKRSEFYAQIMAQKLGIEGRKEDKTGQELLSKEEVQKAEDAVQSLIHTNESRVNKFQKEINHGKLPNGVPVKIKEEINENQVQKGNFLKKIINLI